MFVVNCKAKLAKADAGNVLVKGKKCKKVLKHGSLIIFVFQQPLLMTRILMVDDDRTLSPLVKEYLEAKGFSCDLFHNAFEGLESFKKQSYGLCILDVRMPLKTGFELASEMKLLQPEIPFLFLTGEIEKEKRIQGLELGADDYITKPFSMQELHLRVQAILRRVEAPSRKKGEAQIYQIGGYEFNASTRELKNEEKIQRMSAIEAKLLKLFCDAADGIIERDMALKLIWDDEHNFRERSLNVYVSKLRTYLGEDGRISFLNIHGSGYQMVVKA